MSCVERLSVARDRRPPGASVSPEARLFLHTMTAEGFRFSIVGNRVRVAPAGRLTGPQRVVLRGLFHEIRELLRAEARPH